MNSALSRIRERMNRPDLVIVVIGALGLLVFVSLLVPLRRENVSLAQQLSAATQDRRPESSPVAGAPEVLRFVRALPNDRQRAEDIARMPLLARKHGLQLSQMRFDEADRQADGQLNALNGRIAVEGSYLSIRKWLNDVWEGMPSLAISSLRLNPTADADGKLQAQLEFVYYAGVASAGVSGEASPHQRSRPLPGEASPKADPFRVALESRRPATTAPNVPASQPPFPFTYGGSYRSADNEVYLLIEGDNVHRVRIGETLADEQFRLDKADRHRLELIHLPSSSRYTLLTGNLAP